ncbi:hypothetical protein [Amycolatopsis sp. H20-H5]|uniref:hypothetical protein n=1 Tax=Amycolatopsis sp. H20-H5 TaxID=3046309 RepID=UPI002DB8F38F|nr:hypothetical protein [Amycolatopsis sp. H20-H5]MEC3976065.1 hypothetical protein [Amycolatopsis sp. H20-H5]
MSATLGVTAAGTEQQTAEPRWYLVGALPEDLLTAHLMTRSADLRYRRSACGELQSRTWHAVDPAEAGVPPCAACAATLDVPRERPRAASVDAACEQLTFDLPVG